MKNKVNIIFSIVNFGVEDKLEELILSIKNNFAKQEISYKIIVVNNFSTKESLFKTRELALKYSLKLIENENTGYGSGNNLAINYALQNFDFDFLVVSNPDIKIIKFDYHQLLPNTKSIIAPKIINWRNRDQNPGYYKKHKFLLKLFKKVADKESKKLFFIVIVISKIFKIIDICFNRKYKKKIYLPHGSFIIFPKEIVETLNPIFDNDLFLLCEELVIAEKSLVNKINILYLDNIIVRHFEDASMDLCFDAKKHFAQWVESYKKSYIKYFEEEQ